MPDKEKAILKAIRELPVEEKIKMLPEADKQYLAGFIDRALQNCKPQRDS